MMLKINLSILWFDFAKKVTFLMLNKDIRKKNKILTIILDIH